MIAPICLFPTEGEFLRSQFSQPSISIADELCTDKGDLCIPRYSGNIWPKTQHSSAIFRVIKIHNGLGSWCSRLFEKPGIINYHQNLLSFPNDSMQFWMIRNIGLKISLKLLWGIIRSHGIIRAFTPHHYSTHCTKCSESY